LTEAKETAMDLLGDEGITWYKKQIELTEQHKKRMERVLLSARGEPGYGDRVEHQLIATDERMLETLRKGLAFLENRKT